ncbi:nuclear transport factor 2 family protein [Rhodococcus sp. NPDC056743]|uniref:nuclear transport factor 2 family protein n=1 Tax=Rhodococcus sp. NPDC056743 TaxID=3345934 RepID=UPI003671EA35
MTDLSFDNADTAQQIAEVVAHGEIRKVLTAYCQGVDRRDWQKVLNCYHDDAYDSHGPFAGTRDELVRWLEINHQHVSYCMHQISNVTIDISPSDPLLARSETYCISHKTVTSAKNDPYFHGLGLEGEIRRTIACRYIDTFENRPEVGWRILRREVVLEWMRREPSELYVPLDPALASSHRDKSDLLYAPLATRPVR